MGRTIRVLVANRPRLMRELIVATFADQPDIEIVGEVENDEESATAWMRQSWLYQIRFLRKFRQSCKSSTRCVCQSAPF